MANSKHVVVIGAGAVGTVSAIELLRRGHRVTLLDSGAPGGEQSASYGNAGWFSSHSILPPALPGAWKEVPSYLLDPQGPLALRWFYLPRIAVWLLRYLWSGWTEQKVFVIATALRSLLKDAPSLHMALAQEAGLTALVEHRGVMHVYADREAAQGDAMGWRIRKALGVEVEEWDEATLRQREPMLAEHYRYALFVAEAGRCLNPGAYVAGLARHAQRLGSSVVQERVERLEDSNSMVTAVITPTRTIACDAVVIATGAHGRPLCRMAGQDVPLESERGYHVMVQGTQVGTTTAFMDSKAKMVMNTMTEGLRGAGQVEFAGLTAAPDWRRADILKRHLSSMFPALPDGLQGAPASVWMGHRPAMPDGLPCIGFGRGASNAVYAFGHGHIGLGGSARTGRLVAQLLSDETPEIDLAPFDPKRF